MKRICVYCASSEQVAEQYLDAAHELGRILARAGVTVVYGGGRLGLMGRLAEGSLAAEGKIIGVIPRFMQQLEWGHGGLTELHLVEDMRERKHRMLLDSDAVIALPGGCGTLEELLEAITLKRLGLYFNPIIIVNVAGFFDPLIAMLERCVCEGFMGPEHSRMWQLVASPGEVIAAIKSSRPWPENARDFAVVRARQESAPS
ncbi:MAG TPA: TIGR00730 family Rossman fold protein [Terriglobales bacterium]|nr:TIGR00730 family Rossman fold protein [Terriglobales bacterium]